MIYTNLQSIIIDSKSVEVGLKHEIKSIYEVKDIMARFKIKVENIKINGMSFSADLINYES